MFYSERRAKEFLERRGYHLLKSYYVTDKNSIRNLKLNFPIVMKVSGKNIVHKKKIGGVKLNISDYHHAEVAFDEIKEIDGCEGVIIQSQISGDEFLLGIKKTPEFGHVIVFGAGGSNVENLNDVSFRVSPIKREDAIDMIRETKIHHAINKKEEEVIVDNLMRFNSLIENYPMVSELDINPLIINIRGGFVVDARIVFD